MQAPLAANARVDAPAIVFPVNIVCVHADAVQVVDAPLVRLLFATVPAEMFDSEKQAYGDEVMQLLPLRRVFWNSPPPVE